MNIYYQDILERIRLHYQEMTDTEKLIARFFLDNQKKQDFSAKILSRQLHVSETALSRFAKKIGFSGYREFQYMYEINFHMPKYTNDDVVQKILDTYQKLLQGFNGKLEMDKINAFCQSLSKAERVFIFALGSSACAASEFKLRFMRLGLQVEVIDNPHLMQMQAVLARPEDLVIGMSLSGETREVLGALKAAKLRNVGVTLITSNRRKQLQELFRHVLIIPSIEGLSLGDNISPQFPLLILADIIYSCYMGMDSNYKTALLQDTLSAIQAEEPNDRIVF